ncbi:MAG: OsmC family protein [Actinomycetota bacterium]|jgi:putative redox protein|nr:OsmC family protein [Actinomycetota bacterium]
MDNVTVRWNGKRQFVGWDSAGHGVVMDAPDKYKGEGSGTRPLELMLYAIAGCTGMDVVSVLEKKRQDVRGLSINVEATQREDEYPKIYTHLTVEYVVTGYGVKESAVERAIELSETKYCSVKGMLGPQVKVETRFRVVEADAPAG